MDCSLKFGYMNKKLLVIVNYQCHGEYYFGLVLTTRRMPKGVRTVSLLFYYYQLNNWI